MTLTARRKLTFALTLVALTLSAGPTFAATATTPTRTTPVANTVTGSDPEPQGDDVLKSILVLLHLA